MSRPWILERLEDALSHKRTRDDAAPKLVGELVEMIVDTVEPRLRSHEGYREALEGSVQATLAYLRGLDRRLAPPLLLAAANWAADARLQALFRRPDDVSTLLTQSTALRAFVEAPAHAALQEVFAVLTVRPDARRLLAPSASEWETRLQLQRRLVLNLAQSALADIVALQRKASDLEQRKAYLGTQLRLLQLARDGMYELVDDPATVGKQIAEAKHELGRTVEAYLAAEAELATLDDYIARIEEVFYRPERRVSLQRTPLDGGVMLDSLEVRGRRATVALVKVRPAERA